MLINIRGVETIGAPAAIFAHPVFPRQLALLSRMPMSATVTAASGHWVMATVMPHHLPLPNALATTVAAPLARCNDKVAHLMSNGAWPRFRTATLPARKGTGSGASRLRAASVHSKLRLPQPHGESAWAPVIILASALTQPAGRGLRAEFATPRRVILWPRRQVHAERICCTDSRTPTEVAGRAARKGPEHCEVDCTGTAVL